MLQGVKRFRCLVMLYFQMMFIIYFRDEKIVMSTLTKLILDNLAFRVFTSKMIIEFVPSRGYELFCIIGRAIELEHVRH